MGSFNVPAVTVEVSGLFLCQTNSQRQGIWGFASNLKHLRRVPIQKCSRSRIIFYHIYEPVSVQRRISDTRTITMRPLNLPMAALLD